MAQRIRINNDFREISRSEPAWFAAFNAGVLSGITGSLPTSDPWRTATVDTDGEAKWPDGRTFGLRADTDDVIRPIQEIDDAGIDPTTLALGVGITTAAAALLVVSFGGWRATYAAIVSRPVQHGPDAAIDPAFDAATQAIRWAQHRRRAYRPEVFDTYLDFLVLGWAGWADDVVANGGLSDAAEREIKDRAHKERVALAEVAKALEFFTT